ncbi:TetR family transcriptional regulator [Arthrobacter sp. efr-133-TYG-104]|uniref:TetR/AcrR family transcriptional regulator n=1 Tax=Arthrobacter sp. efr-133-TYG-104 TaxID=3040324 RepID=UPI002549F83D|nr:TetR family transcriptional regulator [Arthrobacter sp. efr-133-TYG-104]
MSFQGVRRGRRSAGDHSRDDILAAARKLFAEQGFDGTSLRQVAREAAVDPAMVHHFFKGKDELFASSVELPADPAVFLADVETSSPSRRAEAIVRAVLLLWEGPAHHGLIAFVRGTLGSTAKTALMREMVNRTILTRLMVGLPGPAQEVRMRGNLVATQVVGLMLVRYVVRLEPIASATQEDVIRMVAPNIQRYLTGDLDSPL